MRFIITIQIWIVTSMHIATLVYYTTDMLTIFQISRYNAKKSCYKCFKLASPLFIALSLFNHKQPFALLISIQKVLTFFHTGIHCL